MQGVYITSPESGNFGLFSLGNFVYNLPPTLTYIDEPMSWESVIASVEFQGKNLRSISFPPIAMNNLGEGQPDAHNAVIHRSAIPRIY